MRLSCVLCRVYELERRVRTPDKYMFPYYEPLHWYMAEYILLYLRGTTQPPGVYVMWRISPHEYA